MTQFKHPFTLTIYKLGGEKATTHSKTSLTCSVKDALNALTAMRDGLPKNFGASLVDARGYNIIGSRHKFGSDDQRVA